MLLQLHFDYACSFWYPNLSVKLKKMKILQFFFLELEKMHLISEDHFKTIIWLLVSQSTQNFNAVFEIGAASSKC